jgi:hypothetical protein
MQHVQIAGQDREVTSYIGQGKRIKVNQPIIPPPIPGCEYLIQSTKTNEGCVLLPPGDSPTCFPSLFRAFSCALFWRPFLHLFGASFLAPILGAFSCAEMIN